MRSGGPFPYSSSFAPENSETVLTTLYIKAIWWLGLNSVTTVWYSDPVEVKCLKSIWVLTTISNISFPATLLQLSPSSSALLTGLDDHTSLHPETSNSIHQFMYQQLSMSWQKAVKNLLIVSFYISTNLSCCHKVFFLFKWGQKKTTVSDFCNKFLFLAFFKT